MNQTKTNTISIQASRTVNFYDHKPTNSEYGLMQFEKHCFASVSEMLYDVSIGRSLTGVFTKDTLSAKERNTNNFVGTQFFFIDIDDDDQHATLKALMSKLEGTPLCPSFAYTTTNHLVYIVNGDNNGGPLKDWTYLGRYRLVYVMNEVINGIDNCNAVATYLYNEVGKALGINLDAHSKSGMQMMHGNGVQPSDGSNHFYMNWDGKRYVKGEATFGNPTQTIDTRLYNYTFSFSEDELKELVEKYATESRKSPKTQENGLRTDSTDEDLMRELEKFDTDEAMLSYHILNDGWRAADKAYVEFDACKSYAVLPDGINPVINCTFCKDYEGTPKVVKRVDGTGRRNLLYSVACKARYNSQTHSAVDVYLNLVWYTLNNIDNSDGQINRNYLVRTTNSVMAIEWDSLVSNLQSRKRNVHKYRVQNGHTWAEARIQISDDFIGEIYDFSISVTENRKAMKRLCEEGVIDHVPSDMTLRRFASDNGVDIKGTAKVKYDPSLSRQENIKAGVPSATVDRYIKKQKLSKF